MAPLSWSLQASMTMWPASSLAFLAIQGQTQRDSPHQEADPGQASQVPALLSVTLSCSRILLS